jgi:hypothetical protein
MTSRLMRVLTVLTLAVACALLSVAAAGASGGLSTGVLPYEAERTAATEPVTFDRTRDAGGTFVRLFLRWYNVAPTGQVKPAGFNAANPADALYRWSDFDREIRLAVQKGLSPIVDIYGAPAWAEGEGEGDLGTVRPNTTELAYFARAAALRYSGTFLDLPRVRHWQVWNEPNLHITLGPQFVGTTPYSPGLYRNMVNAMSDAVKLVHADNIVIAGGTAQFRDLGVWQTNWGPLGFMREFLCLRADLTPKCSNEARFDVWSHHPYTGGGPTHHATLPDDVSLGDLPEMKAVLDAGAAAGNIDSDGAVRFWVTEFSWDSFPPDPLGVPMPLLTRWISEALYRMWSTGVDAVIWLSIRDFPYDPGASFYAVQSGFYFRGATPAADTPKPSLQAFRFPFVAYPAVDGVRFWGRTPSGRQASVVIQQQFQGGWADLGTFASDQHGIVQGRVAGHAVGNVRARTVDLGELSAAFSPRPEHDQAFVPFGGNKLEPDPPPPPAPPAPTVPDHPPRGTPPPWQPPPPPTIPPRPPR